MDDDGYSPIFEYGTGRPVVSQIYGLHRAGDRILEYVFDVEQGRDIMLEENSEEEWPAFLPVQILANRITSAISRLNKNKSFRR